MIEIFEWLSSFNSSDYDKSVFPCQLASDDTAWLGSCYVDLLNKLYVRDTNEQNKTNSPLRASMLGKPALVTAYNYYHPSNRTSLPNPNMRLATIGHYFELWLSTQIFRLGFDIELNLEGVINVHGIDISCHPDLVVSDSSRGSIQYTDDTKLIIECKEVSDYYYKQWFKYNKPDDDRGYITQMSLYQRAFNYDCIMIMGNRVTGEVSFKVIDQGTLDKHYNRAVSIIEILTKNTSCWEDCFQYMAPEPPNQTKKGFTVPFGMKPIADKVYVLDKDGYVIDYKYPKKYLHLKP